ncbi:MAG TPA: hypothetical protein VF534_01270 [Paraburkholderia sp.]
MGQAIEHIRVRLDNEVTHTQFIVGRDVLREVVAEADKLQSERIALHQDLARREFEIQMLQMTQGALKMEIDRLRSQPTITAENATVTISRDGITLTAPMVVMTGDVVPA